MSIEQDKKSTMDIKSTQTRLFARQPLSVFGKIAFWAFLVGALGGVGGTITLTITNGSPSQDIVITTVCTLAGAVILATGFRWAPLASTLLGAYNLYMVCTQPYVVESVANPKGPNGGFAHFAGDVLVLASAILAFGGSIGAAVHNYRQAPRWLPSALSLVAGMIIGALFIGAIAQPPAATGTTYTNGVPTVHMGAGSFLQWYQLLPKFFDKPGRRLFAPPFSLQPPSVPSTPPGRLWDQVMSLRAGRLGRALLGPTLAPPPCSCMRTCIRAWPGSAGLPSPGFSPATCSRRGRGMPVLKHCPPPEQKAMPSWLCAAANATPDKTSDGH